MSGLPVISVVQGVREFSPPLRINRGVRAAIEETTMKKTVFPTYSRSVLVVAVGAVFGACAEATPVAPKQQTPISARSSTMRPEEAILTLQRVTARYHELSLAEKDGFVLLHPCESRGDEGPVGTVYINPSRLFDGVIDPTLPDALIYQPNANGRLDLVGVEFAIPYSLSPERPQFLGTAFQNEDEFGVYALHAWIWLDNPDGLFAETNPRVSCGA